MTKTEADRLTRLEVYLKNQDKKLNSILKQVKQTNGRVNILEVKAIARASKKQAYKNVTRYFLGSGSIFVLFFIAYEFIAKWI